jgi:MOSC domain-containing protein YiiM
VAKVVSLNISQKKGQKKKPVETLTLIQGKGVEGDAHFASARQISLLSVENIQKMQQDGLKVGAGSFAENITTEGFDLKTFAIGTKLKIGQAEIEITEIGKDCHSPCAIYKQAGYCVMPEEGIFAKVLKSGQIKVGDLLTVNEKM